MKKFKIKAGQTSVEDKKKLIEMELPVKYSSIDKIEIEMELLKGNWNANIDKLTKIKEDTGLDMAIPKKIV